MYTTETLYCCYRDTDGYVEVVIFLQDKTWQYIVFRAQLKSDIRLSYAVLAVKSAVLFSISE